MKRQIDRCSLNDPVSTQCHPPTVWLVQPWGASPAVLATARRQGWLHVFYSHPLQPMNLSWLVGSWVLPENVLEYSHNFKCECDYLIWTGLRLIRELAREKAKYKCSKEFKRRAKPGTLLFTQSIPRQETPFPVRAGPLSIITPFMRQNLMVCCDPCSLIPTATASEDQRPDRSMPIILLLLRLGYC